MTFTWDYKMNDFLFKNFNIDSVKKCVVVVFAVFLLAYLSHVIKTLQVIINHKMKIKWTNAANEHSEQTPLVQSLRIPTNSHQITTQRFMNHVTQSVLYMVNLIVTYLLMLAVMNYYAGHFISTVLGFTFGYYMLFISPPDNVSKSVRNNLNENEDETGSQRTSETRASTSGIGAINYEDI